MAVEPERQLGGGWRQEVAGSAGVVVEEELVQRPAQAPALALPEQGTAGEAAGLDEGELLVADAVQPFPVGGPPGPVVVGQVVGLDHLGEEPVEHLVGQRAAVPGRDAVLVGRVVERADAEDVPHEVGVRALDPRLQAGGGQDCPAVGRRGEVVALDQPGEPGQVRLLAAPVQVDPAGEDGIPVPAVAGVDRESAVAFAQKRRKPVLVDVGGLVDPLERLGERGRGVEPVGVEPPAVGELLGGGTPAQDGLDLVEQPPRRHGLDLGAEVAAGVDEHLVAGAGGERGEHGTVEVGLVVGPDRQRSAGLPSDRVGQERVVPAAGWDGALGHADDHDPVQVEAGGGADAADEHAVAEPALAVDLPVEPVGHGAPEVAEARCRLDRPQPGQVAEQVADPVVGVGLLGRPVGPVACRAEVVLEQAEGPPGEARPVGGTLRRVDVLGEAFHEGQQLLGPDSSLPGPPERGLVGALGLEFGEPGVLVGGESAQPVGPLAESGHDAGPAGDALPGGGRNGEAVDAEYRPRGQQGHDRRTREVVVGEGQQRQQGAAGEGVAEAPSRHAVERHVGGGQVLVEQAGVAVGAGVGDGHAVERDAVPGAGHHLSYGQPGLLVGVGDRSDQQSGVRGDGWRIGEGTVQSPDQVPQRIVGGLVAGAGCDHRQRPPVGQCLDECQPRGRQSLGEVEDEGAQVVEQRVAGGDGGRGGAVQVDLVDVPAVQSAVDLAVEAHDLGGPWPGGGQGVEVGGVEFAQFAVDAHQRPLGGRVAGDGPQQVGGRGQHGSDRCRHDGVGDPLVAPAAGLEGGAGEQPGQVEERLEAHRGQALGPPGGQRASGRHAHEVGRHHHGDRGQHVATLGRGDGVAQCGGGGCPVGRERERGGHDRTESRHPV